MSLVVKKPSVCPTWTLGAAGRLGLLPVRTGGRDHESKCRQDERHSLPYLNGFGRGVRSDEGGSSGSLNAGWSPVRVLRNATIAAFSASV